MIKAFLKIGFLLAVLAYFPQLRVGIASVLNGARTAPGWAAARAAEQRGVNAINAAFHHHPVWHGWHGGWFATQQPCIREITSTADGRTVDTCM